LGKTESVCVKSKANVMLLKSDDQNETRLDWLKWALVIVLVLAGLIGNHYYSAFPMAARTIGWLTILVISGFIASTTQKGRWMVEFFRDSRMELRKVVWPTREETVQTTLIVAAMVVILALVLWGMDGILVWLIGWLTGQRS
jgi:preprotein translocase subunit SecE